MTHDTTTNPIQALESSGPSVTERISAQGFTAIAQVVHRYMEQWAREAVAEWVLELNSGSLPDTNTRFYRSSFRLPIGEWGDGKPR